MAILNIEDLCVGMIVENDIRNQAGAIMLKAGQPLTERHIDLLETWGISDLEIVEEKKKINIEEVPLHTKEKLDYIFQVNGCKQPVMKMFFDLRLEKEAAAGWPEMKIECLPEVERPNVDFKAINWNEDIFPEIPEIVGKLQKVMADERSTSRDIACVIERSPSLTTKLLRLANSPFYGFYSKVETVSRAITVIGTKEVGEIVIGLSVFENFKNIKIEKIDIKNFFQHCLYCGVLSRVIAMNKRLENAERFFIYGLIHKVGRLLIFSHFSELAQYLIAETYNKDKLLTQVEQNMGIDHAKLMGELAQKWSFSPTLIDNISHYLQPGLAQSPIEASIIHLADVITHALGIGESGDIKVPPLSSLAMSVLSFDENILSVIMEQASHQFEPLMKVFFE